MLLAEVAASILMKVRDDTELRERSGAQEESEQISERGAGDP